jgi:hypothetical protein
MVERYPTQTLLGMFSEIKRPKRYLLERFFPREQTFSTEEVMFDKILETRRLAPFVSWHVKGKPMPRAGEELKPFKPPYVKPKFALTPDLAIKTMPGESLQGSMSPQQRIDRIRTQMLQEQDDMITRREEWMASELLRTGTLTVTAEDHPPMTINLGRPSGHTIALTTTARWGETDVSPYQNLRTWAGTVAAAAGVAPTEVIMDPLAATLLLQDPYIKTIFNIQNYQPPQSTINLLGSLAVPDEVQPLGSFGGFNFFQYQSTYLNADGTVGQYMPDYTAILASPTGANGVRTYGAIMDHGRPVPASRFPKEWVDEDPSVHWLMTQSAPLPLLERPEATLCATVR